MKAKFSRSGIERQSILNPHAVALWCLWYGCKPAELYDQITTDGTIVKRIERFTRAIQINKPSMGVMA
jgi:hypothetical protein